MDIKVFYHDWGAGDSIIFYSKEFGWMEYLDDWGMYSPLIFKSKKELICNIYNADSDKKRMEMFKKNSTFTYLGYL